MARPDTSTASAAAERAPGSAFSAALYDPFLALGEKRGMKARRQRLLSQATGAVIEVGAGTGLNAGHYSADLERLVLCEPEEHMAERLGRRVEDLGVDAEVVRAAAEVLPFDDASFDTVTGTLVLCTVQDPVAALSEIRRVLRPGGRFLFAEHVRADDGSRLAKWQDRMRGPWAAFADGCTCNQRTLELIEAAGLTVENVEHENWRSVPPLVRPLVVGSASNSG